MKYNSGDVEDSLSWILTWKTKRPNLETWWLILEPWRLN
jgi:hypothetical protein